MHDQSEPGARGLPGVTSPRSLRVAEALLGGGVLALGVFVAIGTARLEVAPTHAAVGPRLFPFLVAAGLVLVGLAVLREAFFGHVAHERGGLALDGAAVGWVSAGLVAQMLLIERVGWIPTAALLFAATARAFGSRRPLLDALIGAALAAAAFLVFNQGLGLSLPAGTLVEGWLEPAADAR